MEANADAAKGPIVLIRALGLAPLQLELSLDCAIIVLEPQADSRSPEALSKVCFGGLPKGEDRTTCTVRAGIQQLITAQCQPQGTGPRQQPRAQRSSATPCLLLTSTYGAHELVPHPIGLAYSQALFGTYERGVCTSSVVPCILSQVVNEIARWRLDLHLCTPESTLAHGT